MNEDRRSKGQGRKLGTLVNRFLGGFFLLMGIIGIFVPIWPTTCFLLFAVGFFARSSPRMHGWMLANRYFGRHLRDYREQGTVEPRILAFSLLSLWVSLGVSISLVSPPTWVAIMILGVGAAVTLHLLTLRTSPSAPGGRIPAAE